MDEKMVGWWYSVEAFFDLNFFMLECLDERVKVAFVKTLLTPKVAGIIAIDRTTTVDSIEKKLKQYYAKPIDWESKVLELNQTENELEQDKNDVNNRFKQLFDRINAIEEQINQLSNNNKLPNNENDDKENRPSKVQYQYENNNWYHPYKNEKYLLNNQNLTCYHCNKIGHSYLVCRLATKTQKEQITERLN